MMQMRLRSWAGPIALAVCLFPSFLAAEPLPDNRQSVRAIMAQHPDDPEIQQAGQRALDALDALDAALSRGTRVDMPPVELAGQPAGATVTGPSAFPNPMEGLDSWNIDENYWGAAIAREDWTVNNDYPGTKLALSGRYSLYREEEDPLVSDCDCSPPPPAPIRLIGTVSGQAQAGDDDLERIYVGVSTIAWQRNFPAEQLGWEPLRDTLDLGAGLVGRDDALGINSYTEITLARAGRTWGWMPESRKFLVMAGVGLSTGYAWAESTRPEYADVSNPIIGSWTTLGIAWPDWGNLYVEQHVINGFSFSSPSARDSTSREAIFRAGFIKKLPACMSLELFADKRSFTFSDFNLQDLYTKARRIGVELGCSW